MNTKEYKAFDAEPFQKAHSFEKEKVGTCLRMVQPADEIEIVIDVLKKYDCETDEKKELRQKLVCDYEAVLAELKADEENDRASIVVAPADGIILQESFQNAYDNHTLKKEGLLDFMIEQDEVLFHLNHDLSDDSPFWNDDEIVLEIAEDDLPQ